ncbi:hypothetical protein HDV05_008792 [Chytridiales sp. JEL 0842]|nr:hypothetical protein HDV05_008792 [Chytridiales sp. JEL 0842]
MTIDPSPILDLINAFRRSKVLFTFVSTGIVDILHSHGPLTAAGVQRHLTARGRPSQLIEPIKKSSAAGAGQESTVSYSVDAVDRLLRASVNLGLADLKWRIDDRTEPQYELTPLAVAYLAPSAKTPLSGYILHSDATLYPLWGELSTSLQTGQPSWEAAFPEIIAANPSISPFNALYSTPESRERFMHAMHSHSALISPDIASAFDLSWAQHAIDLGGGTGALAIEIARKWNHLQVTIVDLPEVVQIAKKSYLVGEDEALSRVNAVSGDFLKDSELPHGDLYVLSRILHDWDESRCEYLLKRIYDSLAPASEANSSNQCSYFSGGLLIAEAMLNEDKTGPSNAIMQDINMLVQTGGRERSLSEYQQLLQKVGFKEVRGVRTGGYLDAIMAFK